MISLLVGIFDLVWEIVGGLLRFILGVFFGFWRTLLRQKW